MMDKEIQKRIIEKTRMKMAISNLEKEEINMKKPQNSFIKTAATIILTIGATGGIVFAGFTAYEKIWKEPREYNVHEEKPPIISTVEKEKYVTEELIQEKANKFLAIAGYPDKQVKKIEIKRSYADNSNAYYSTRTENEYHNATRNIGIYLDFNADTGKLEYLLNNDFEYDGIVNKLEQITENQAIEISKQVLNELEWSLDGYEVKNCNLNNKNEWSIEYSKSYNGVYNSNDSIKIFFGVINKQPVVESISIFIDDAFENNEFVISEDEAINIAKAKEMELSDVDISSATAKKDIRKMNTFIYSLENDRDTMSGVKTDDRIRNVWVVQINHVGEEVDKVFKVAEGGMQGLKKYGDKKYYVDATTGEIIAGEQVRYHEE